MPLIAALLYPDVMSLDVTGPLQVFASANLERERQGLPAHYQLRLLGATEGLVRTSAGIGIQAEQGWYDLDVGEVDTLLVPGGLGIETLRQDAGLLAWLRDLEPLSLIHI